MLADLGGGFQKWGFLLDYMLSKSCSNSMIGCVNKFILFKRWEELSDANVVIGEEEKSSILASKMGVGEGEGRDTWSLLRFELCPHFCLCLDMIME